MPRQQVSADQATDLLRFAEQLPLGFTFDEMHQQLNLSRSAFQRASKRARERLRAGTQQFVGQPQGFRQPWRYVLTGDFDLIQRQVDKAIVRMMSAARTGLVFVDTLINMTDVASLEGQQVRMTQRSIQRAIEDLDELKTIRAEQNLQRHSA